MRSRELGCRRRRCRRAAGRRLPGSTARSPRGTGRLAGTATGAASCQRRPDPASGTPARNAESRSAGRSRPANGSHSAPSRHRHAAPERGHLVEVHQPGMVVLVPGEGQPVALDRIGDEAGRPVVGDGMEGVEHRRHVVAAEIGHQPLQRGIVVIVEDRADAGIAVEVALQMLAPALAALVDQRRIERVRAGVDPLAQMMAVGPGEGGLQQPPVFQGDDAPAHHLEQRVDAAEQPVGDHGVEALAVVVDDPPEIADIVLPAFEQRLEDVAFVEFGVAGERDHPARRLVGRNQLLSAADNPAPSSRTRSCRRRGRPSRSRNRRCRRPWSATDRIARRHRRGTAPASRGSDGRAGIGSRETPARRAA